MKILLTGDRGRLGPTIRKHLLEDGHDVAGYDLADGHDILDAAAVQKAAHGKEVIVHVAGVAGDRSRTPAELLTVNLAGTANVLVAAEAEKVARVIYLSSGRSLGMLDRNPAYLPVDDDHPGLPPSNYGLAKWLAEEMCAAFTARAGFDTICLRSVAVFNDDDYRTALEKGPQFSPHGKVWPLGVHIDVRDVAHAVVAAVRCPSPGHVRLLLCAADIADKRPTMELVKKYMPEVEWRGADEYRRDPFRSLMDISRAKRSLVGSHVINGPAGLTNGGESKWASLMVR